MNQEVFIMKKGVKKQMAAVALSLLTVSGIGLSVANVVKAASPFKKMCIRDRYLALIHQLMFRH